MNVTFTLPIWGIIALAVTTGTPVIWGLISMYFKQVAMKEKLGTTETNMKEILSSSENSMKEKLLSLEKDVAHQDKSITTFKKDIEDKLDKHKLANDSRLLEISNKMIQTKTLVELLVNDKIKNTHKE